LFQPQAGIRCPEMSRGLGLSIVKRIAEQHHADVSLEAGADGRGLTVTVRFGAARQA
ncbi:ATP-binding protein, partial [Burkholderia thailandensis]|uniref:ATP-binding protein n=1 Tax=Burkholderia thailandensis TaxID=57975 RepID=UPI00217EF6AC